MVKAKTKADRAAARAAASGGPKSVEATAPAALTAMTPVSGADDSSDGPATASQSHSAGEDQTDSHSQAASAAGEPADPAGPGAPTGSAPTPAASSRDKEKEKHSLRLSLLKEKPELVLGFMRSMVPILVDVYAASVAIQVRSRSLAGILKAVSWFDADDLTLVLKVSTRRPSSHLSLG